MHYDKNGLNTYCLTINNLILLNVLLDRAPSLKTETDGYIQELQPWLAKTSFPDTWPVVDTNEAEITELMANGKKIGINVITFDANSGKFVDQADFKPWAKALLGKNFINFH